MLQELREKMESTTHIGGLKLNPILKLTDALVLSFSLALANTAMNPRLIVADREKLIQNLDKHVSERLAALDAASPEQRRAMLELLVAGSADVSPFDTTAPLRAAKTEGSKPS